MRTMILISFILVTLTSGGLCTIIYAPLNVIDVVGTQVTLSCESNITASPAEIDWYFEEDTGNYTKFKVVSGCVATEGYSVQSTSEGQCNLNISSLEGRYAGRYTCQNGNEAPVSARVGAIVNGPSCQTIAPSPVIEGDLVLISCSTEYDGTFGVRNGWGYGLANARSQPNEESGEPHAIVTPFNSVKSNISTAAVKPTVRPVTYTLSFNVYVPDPPFGNATNTPSYEYSWTSLAMTVLYKPDQSKMKISGCFLPLVVGQELTCSAPADPPANYTWMHPNGTETSGASVTVDQIGSGANYTCVAWNSIGSSYKYCGEPDNINSGTSYGFSLWVLIIAYAAIYLSNGDYSYLDIHSPS